MLARSIGSIGSWKRERAMANTTLPPLTSPPFSIPSAPGSAFAATDRVALGALAGDGGRHRQRTTEGDPDVGVLLRLALDEAVAGLEPGQDAFDLVVENELAAIGLDREHRVALVPAVAHHGDEERLARPAGLDQQPHLSST